MIEVIAAAGMVIALSLLCVFCALNVYDAWLDHKRAKRLDEMVDMHLTVTQLRYKAALDELAKEGGEDADA